jgi:hypothetical protein
MTAPDTQGPSEGSVPGSPDPNPYAAAEKLMAQWEARHAIAAAGRRVGQGVPQYLSHERCTEASASPTHHHERTRQRAKPRPAPDVHPHVSDLLAWVLPPHTDDDVRPGRRSHPAD